MTTHPEKREESWTTLARRRAAGAVQSGWLVLAALLVLHLVEFALGQGVDKNLPYMIVMNLIDAGLIMYFFMHIARLWHRGEEK